MWNRADLKLRAKNTLKTSYWMAFLAALIMGIASGGGSGVFSYNFNTNDVQNLRENGFDLNTFLGSFWVQILAGVMLAFVLIGIAYTIFVGAVIHVGSVRWFSRNRETAGTPSLSQLVSLFRKGKYMGTVRSMFWRNLWLFIWGILTVLPSLAAGAVVLIQSGTTWTDLTTAAYYQTRVIDGLGILLIGIGVFLTLVLSVVLVAKQYSYFLTPWILADNPNIGARRALNLSKAITRGNKLDMFVLDLSFIGWWLLGLLACCIGGIFVRPYYLATLAELYAALRDDGVGKGLTTMEELGYQRVPSQSFEPVTTA